LTLQPRTDPPRGLLNLDLADGAVTLHRYVPSTRLQQVVEHYWSIRWDLRDRPPFTSESLPYPSVHMVVENGTWRLTGVVTRRFDRALVGSGGVFGIKFRPGGFRPFVDGSVAQFTGRTIPADAVLAWAAALPKDAVLPAAELVGSTETVLLRALPEQCDAHIDRVQALIALVAEDRGIVRVEQLAEAGHIAPRALQRMFRDYVGVSPKWVIQRYRLFEAAERLAAGDVDGAEVAQALGYFDQAHFIRDFKALVGRSPHAYALEKRVA
jgi:AraC-like DNA-binding protein